jgi:putative nucleotidyltransferase with HDIG domain
MTRESRAVAANRSTIDERLKSLPPLPAVVSRLLPLDPDDDFYLDHVYRLARQDPTLSVRLVEYATRTIAYETAKDRLDLRHAIARLGTLKIAGLVTALSLLQAFEPRTPADRDLWIHSVETAVIAGRLASLMPDLGLVPEQMYLAGLLHDIGRFVVFQSIPDAPTQLDETGWRDPDGLVEAEMSVLGFCHGQVGALACTEWGLPQSLAQIAAGHHSLNLPRQSPAEKQFLNRICLIQAADAYSIFLMERSARGETFDAWSDIESLQQEIQGLIDRFVDVHIGQFPLMYRMVIARQLARGTDAILAETRTILGGLGIECPSLFGGEADAAGVSCESGAAV